MALQSVFGVRVGTQRAVCSGASGCSFEQHAERRSAGVPALPGAIHPTTAP